MTANRRLLEMFQTATASDHNAGLLNRPEPQTFKEGRASMRDKPRLHETQVEMVLKFTRFMCNFRIERWHFRYVKGTHPAPIPL